MLSGQLVEQRLCLFQIERIEAFGKPAVDGCDRIPLALIAPEPRHAHRGAEFPGPCLLRPRDSERAFAISYRIQLGCQP